MTTFHNPIGKHFITISYTICTNSTCYPITYLIPCIIHLCNKYLSKPHLYIFIQKLPYQNIP
ncbi:hypothetical protein F383_22535 [Gossypium arboreum]|uniref:Uncharacterized protein n=1 Tax=Gossypium arboreum TaxID=29729 RepID=A0A0B0NQR7_GOSAR|nr:hypothetical protein F383_22535 [Gossypium arboreum]